MKKAQGNEGAGDAAQPGRCTSQTMPDAALRN
jgi:hypothetical protein